MALARLSKVDLVLCLGLKAFRRDLDEIQKTERIHSRPSLRFWQNRSPCFEAKTRSIAGFTERHEIFGPAPSGTAFGT